MIEPHWEHGYRCHGYWAGAVLLGRVSIGPRKYWKPSDGYGWRVKLFGRSEIEGNCKTLKAAKLMVEREVRRALDEGWSVEESEHKRLYTFR